MPEAATPGSPPDTPVDDVIARVRIPLIQRATIVHADVQEELFVIDIGLLGLFVERAAALPVGDSVSVRLPLPGNVIPIQAWCRVAWWHQPGRHLVTKSLPAGLGLEFVEISASDRIRVRQLVVEYLQRHPQLRRFHRPAGPAL